MASAQRAIRVTMPANKLGRINALSAICLLLVGCGLLGLAGVGDPYWREWGGKIRKPADVTAERIARLRQGLAFFSVVALAGGGWLVAKRQLASDFLSGALAEIPQLPLGIAESCKQLGPATMALAAAIFAFGVWSRLWFIHVPMDYDEAYSFLNFARRSWIEAISDYNTTNNHVLNTFCMHWCYRIFGQQDWALRLPVLFAGIATITLAGVWAGMRFGRDVGLTTMALVAASPLLVYYSTNARGYLYLTAAALVFDICIAHISVDGRYSRSASLVAAVAVALGLAAMPNAIYAIAATLLWSLPATFRAGNRPKAFTIIGASLFGGLLACAIYFPAFVFRGFQAFEHRFVQPLPAQEWFVATPTAWLAAVASWCQGPVAMSHPWLIRNDLQLRTVAGDLAVVWPWIAVACVGLFIGLRNSTNRIWLLAFPVATLAIMGLQRVAPPIRLFLFLAPWFFVLVAIGLTSIVRILRVPSRIALASAAAFFALSAAYFVSVPVAFDPADRAVVMSVPDVVDWIAMEDGQRKLSHSSAIVPLPCDVPALYYAAKIGLPLEVNTAAIDSKNVWLVTAFDQQPETTFDNISVRDNLPPEMIESQRVRRWQLLESFRTLSIRTSR